MIVFRDDTKHQRSLSVIFKLLSVVLCVLATYLLGEVFTEELPTDSYPQITDLTQNTTNQITVSEIPYLLVAGVLYLFAVPLFCLGRTLGAMSAFEIMLNDPRKPVVFLCSFRNDAQNTSFNLVGQCFSQKTPEEELMELFAPIGPMIGIGQPEDSRRPLGIPRVYVDKISKVSLPSFRSEEQVKKLSELLLSGEKEDFNPENWKVEISQLVEKSSLILISYDITAGTKWEVDYVLRSQENNPEKVLFLFSDPERWYKFQENYGQLYGHSIASIKEHVQYLGFFNDGRPDVISHYPESENKNVESDFYTEPEIEKTQLNKFIDQRKIKKPFNLRYFIKWLMNY